MVWPRCICGKNIVLTIDETGQHWPDWIKEPDDCLTCADVNNCLPNLLCTECYLQQQLKKR